MDNLLKFKTEWESTSQKHDLDALLILLKSFKESMVSVHGGNASLGRFYWNLAIQFKYSKNVHIEAHLRLIGFLLIYNDKETQLFDDNELQLLIMATKVGIAWMACNEFGDAHTAFLLGCKIKDCDTAPKDHKDFKKASSNLLIHMAQLDWVTSKSPSSFLIINRAIDDSSDHYTFHDIIKILNICKSLASLSENGDAIKWLKLALRTIDIAPGIPDQYLDIKKEFSLSIVSIYLESNLVQSAEEVLDTLFITHENDIEVYYWKVKVLESKKANDTTFSAILDTVKNIWLKTTKREPSVFQWIVQIIHIVSRKGLLDESLQCLRDLMLEETASIVPKLLSNVENLTPSDYILMTSIFLIIESNREDIANQIEKVLEYHGPLDLGTPVTNICIPMLWRVADKYANTQCDWGKIEAAKLYTLCCQFFSTNLVDSRNHSIIQRKLAFCHIQLKQFTEALTACLKSIALDNRDSPTTNFMLFTIYLEFEEVEKALHHLKQITFQKNSELYIMAADVAFEKNQKPLLLDILKTAASGNFVIPDSKNRTRLLIIIRCLIRLMYEQLIGLKSNQISADTVKDIYSYFDKGIQVLNTLNNTEHDIDAETEWLFRSCWNTSVYLSKNFDDPTISNSFFKLTITIIKMIKSQTDLHSHTLKSCLFMCVFSNISILRTQRDSDQVSVTLSSINSLRNQLVANPNESFDTSLIHLVFTMEFEVYCISNQWEQVENLMAGLNIMLPTSTLQRCVDILIPINPPNHILILTLRLTLDSMLKEENFDCNQFASWAQYLTKIYLYSNSYQSECFLLADQILSIATTTKSFPENELLWMTVKYWNQGTELLAIQDGLNGQQWIAYALKLADCCSPCSQISEIRKLYQLILEKGF